MISTLLLWLVAHAAPVAGGGAATLTGSLFALWRRSRRLRGALAAALKTAEQHAATIATSAKRNEELANLLQRARESAQRVNPRERTDTVDEVSSILKPSIAEAIQRHRSAAEKDKYRGLVEMATVRMAELQAHVNSLRTYRDTLAAALDVDLATVDPDKPDPAQQAAALQSIADGGVVVTPAESAAPFATPQEKQP